MLGGLALSAGEHYDVLLPVPVRIVAHLSICRFHVDLQLGIPAVIALPSQVVHIEVVGCREVAQGIDTRHTGCGRDLAL